MSLNYREKCGFQENSSFSNSPKIQAKCYVYGAKSKKIQGASTSKLFQEKSKKSLDYFSWPERVNVQSFLRARTSTKFLGCHKVVLNSLIFPLYDSTMTILTEAEAQFQKVEMGGGGGVLSNC